MSSWASTTPKRAFAKGEAGKKLTPDVLNLANEFKLVDGELLLDVKPFKTWLKRGQAVPPSAREVYAEELLVLASKFYEFGGESVARAVAQLFALAADVMGKTIEDGPTK